MSNNNRFTTENFTVKVLISLTTLFKELTGCDVNLYNIDDEITDRRIKSLKEKYKVEENPFFVAIHTSKHHARYAYEFSNTYSTDDYSTAEAYNIATNFIKRKEFTVCKSYNNLNNSLKIVALEEFLCDKGILYTEDHEGKKIDLNLRDVKVNNLLFAKYFYNKREFAELNIQCSNEKTLKTLKSVKQIPEFLI